jgi:hypothetical protein
MLDEKENNRSENLRKAASDEPAQTQDKCARPSDECHKFSVLSFAGGQALIMIEEGILHTKMTATTRKQTIK